MSVTVHWSGVTYREGEFVSNLVFTGVYTEDVARFSGVVKVCEDRAMVYIRSMKTIIFTQK